MINWMWLIPAAMFGGTVAVIFIILCIGGRDNDV